MSIVQGANDLTIIVLTLNEEVHIKRCIESVQTIASKIVIVDSGSTDCTCEIARELGASVLVNPFTTHAKQLNWALDHAAISTQWVMKLDADEYITPDLVKLLPHMLSNAGDQVNGFTLNLRRIFMGKWLKHGALYPIRLLRIWRFGFGLCEDRWMDEHIIVDGQVKHINADFADDNQKSLTWWTEKHNMYSNREAVVLLNLEYHFLPHDSSSRIQGNKMAAIKRWMKVTVYARLPNGFRACAYFFYRYVIRFGFLDGQAGAVFHFLQGFWYRYLVDAKVMEVKRHMRDYRVDVVDAIEQVLGIKV
ncbi:glycosyl transferase family 2 [Mariprofundus micogutta]|uniref:Glycosyl transferase family 2 n=1 Tax=Mariprofundus micogutta TaxID=1921010 RepID=A0A1L8CLW3_9PROT|nr:glycosyltransferase family 2 protein [Mariprofundus micogutta]GAV19893.1 glycosyl transferase family 2 [Mariprofundus micogutta]